MQKEILTAERCREDLAPLLRINYSKLTLPLIFIGIMAIPIMLVLYFLQHEPPQTSSAGVYVIVTLFGLMLILALGQFMYTLVRLSRMRRCQFDVVEDQLQSVSQDAERINVGIRGSALGSPDPWRKAVYLLNFEGIGSYRIPTCPHYEWSDLYAMSYDEVYETARPGDRFYVILLKYGRRSIPMMVYNTRLFEFCEDKTGSKSSGSWRDSVDLDQ